MCNTLDNYCNARHTGTVAQKAVYL